MTEAERMAYDYILGVTSTGMDGARTAIALRSAKAQSPETYREVQRMAMRKRAEFLTTRTMWQRKWMASVSRRPARGRHHDSWAIRERYARCSH